MEQQTFVFRLHILRQQSHILSAPKVSIEVFILDLVFVAETKQKYFLTNNANVYCAHFQSDCNTKKLMANQNPLHLSK